MDKEFLERQLNDFDLKVRTQALDELLSLELPPSPNDDNFNLHCHSLFSFNAFGYSPTALAWLAKRQGYKAMGIVDFDVLDGVNEFLDACEKIGVRGTASIETRVYLPEFETREINSPGEPGVAYHMGIGFSHGIVPRCVKHVLKDLQQRIVIRNQVMINRLNAYLDPVGVSYKKDVIPLTPAGNVTERHIVKAYLQKAEENYPFKDNLKAYWVEKLDLPLLLVDELIADVTKFSNTVRSKLIKQGGVGYVQPDADSFPSIQEFNQLVIECGALPCIAWLDGMSEGEQTIDKLFDMHISEGAVAINIIPDRNWNIADPEQRRLKIQNLYNVVLQAQEYDLPIIVGTEMNSPGQKCVDDLSVPELAPVKDVFVEGMHFLYGHTVMKRYLDQGYQSKWAKVHLPTRRERNEFYTKVGQLAQPSEGGLLKIRNMPTSKKPKELLEKLQG